MPDKFNILSISGKGKGFKVFSSDAYKEHEKPQMAQMFWRMRWVFVMWVLTVLAFGLAFAGEYLWRYGWSPATQIWMHAYFDRMIFTFGLSIFAEIPAWLTRAFLRPDLPAIVPFIPLVVYQMLTHVDFLKEFNPHGKDIFQEKTARMANEKDIEKMGKAGTSLFKGFMIVLGRFKKKYIMLNETLSVLCVAPPGTGKTWGVVIPTVLKCDGVSMIINDVKPELDFYTSGYRSTLGPVFIINWGGQDDPERGIYYPSWNPLSPEHVPFQQEKRDLYVDSICMTLIPDKAGSTADPHWTISGRSALSGLIQFIVSKVERARANDYFEARFKAGTFNSDDAAALDSYYTAMLDPNAEAARHALRSGQMTAMNYVHVGTWAGVPPAWVGKEASLSLILDWINTNQIRIAEELENRRKQGDQMVMMADPMKDMFFGAVDEARQYGYAHRAILELTQLANTPDKERGSILSTVMAGLGIFRNAAVRNRTSHSDFHFSDLRGIKNPKTGKWEPVSIYISINLVDAEALNPITAIFVELMSQFLITNKPDDIHAGQKLGPYPVLFALDEMPKMQKLDAVIKGPDLGRSAQVSYLIIGQNLHQFSEKYGKDAAETILATTAAKIVFRQNDMDSARKFSELVGKKLVVELKEDEKTGDPFGKEDKVDKDRLISEQDILKLPRDKMYVIMQGWTHRPIEAEVPYAFEDAELMKLTKMPKANPLPEFLIPAHHSAMGYRGNPRIYDVKTKTTKEIVMTKMPIVA